MITAGVCRDKRYTILHLSGWCVSYLTFVDILTELNRTKIGSGIRVAVCLFLHLW